MFWLGSSVQPVCSRLDARSGKRNICLTSGLCILLKDKMIVSHFLSKLEGDVTDFLREIEK